MMNGKQFEVTVVFATVFLILVITDKKRYVDKGVGGGGGGHSTRRSAILSPFQKRHVNRRSLLLLLTMKRNPA